MLKVTVLYPVTADSTFDVDYYRTTHAEIVNRVLGPERFEIDKGQDGQPYHALGHLYFASPEAMQAAMTNPDAGQAAIDEPNFYRGGEAQLQISETVD